MWRDLKIQLESDQLTKDVAVKLGVAKIGDDISDIRSKIRIARILYRDYRTLVVEVYATDPELVRDYAGALVQVYQENQAKERKEQRERATAKYLTEVDQLREKINEGLSKRLDFEEKNKMAELTIKQERLMKLPSEIDRCQAQMKRMEEIKNSFDAVNTEGTDVVSKLSLLSAFDKEWSDEEKAKTGDVVKRAPSEKSPFLQGTIAPTQVDVRVVGPQVSEGPETWRKLERELRSLIEEIRQQSQKYLPGHEVMVKLETRLSEVNHGLASELEVAMQRFDLEYQRVKNRLPELKAQEPEYYETVKQYEEFRTKYAMLAKGEEDWGAAHADLSKRLAAMQFGDNKSQVELDFNGFEILSDREPVSPTTRKALMLSIALALGLGLGVPVGLQFINSTVSRIPQLENRFGMRGLGMVPKASSKMLEDIFRAPAMGSKIPNFLLECFRVIRSNIILHPGSEGKSQVVVITSSRPSEGKSTLAANLSWAFFSMGERTLLIDTDLRRGRAHQILGLENSKGLSTYFKGEATEKEIIQVTGNPNLDVITRGEFMPGASEYLCRQVFADLILNLRGRYDRIVLDSPPVLGLSETIGIQRVADGVVVLVRAEQTKLVDVDNCVDQLKRGGAQLLGFVLNRLDLAKPSNHYYYYYSSPYYYTHYSEDGADSMVQHA